MMTARPLSASTPVAPTTAAIAPKAPTGASHMIMPRMRNTSFWTISTAAKHRLAGRTHACTAKPTSSATSSVCSTDPEVSDETATSG